MLLGESLRMVSTSVAAHAVDALEPVLKRQHAHAERSRDRETILIDRFV